MTKKNTAVPDSPDQERSAVSTDSAPVETNRTRAGGPPSGFYIYLGPTIHGLIQANTIYRGDRAHALEEAQAAVRKYPLVKTLIVSGDYLPEARLKVKTSGNALHANYVKLAGQVKDGRRKEAAANG
jgi:hypothetical protein